MIDRYIIKKKWIEKIIKITKIKKYIPTIMIEMIKSTFIILITEKSWKKNYAKKLSSQ